MKEILKMDTSLQEHQALSTLQPKCYCTIQDWRSRYLRNGFVDIPCDGTVCSQRRLEAELQADWHAVRQEYRGKVCPLTNTACDIPETRHRYRFPTPRRCHYKKSCLPRKQLPDSVTREFFPTLELFLFEKKPVFPKRPRGAWTAAIR